MAKESSPLLAASLFKRKLQKKDRTYIGGARANMTSALAKWVGIMWRNRKENTDDDTTLCGLYLEGFFLHHLKCGHWLTLNNFFFCFKWEDSPLPHPVWCHFISSSIRFSLQLNYSNDFIIFIYRETNPQKFVSQDVVRICYFSFSRGAEMGKNKNQRRIHNNIYTAPSPQYKVWPTLKYCGCCDGVIAFGICSSWEGGGGIYASGMPM